MPTLTGSVTPRPYQHAIIEKARSAMDEGLSSALIVSPTGSGKTLMALWAGDQIRRDMGREDAPIVWVSHRRKLLQQAQAEAARMGLSNVHPLSVFDQRRLDEICDTYSRPILVLDEAHHSAADTCVAVWERIMPSFTIGLSATPLRLDRRKLCFQRTLHDSGYTRLVQDGFLASYDQFLLPELSPQVAASVFLQDPKQWGRTAMFFLNTEQCEEAARLLMQAGVRCAITGAGIDNDSVLDRFDSGDLDVVLGMVLLAEGWDCPGLETVFIRDGSQGPVMQIAGRVLRLHPEGRSKRIVQSVHTDWDFARTLMPASIRKLDSLDGDWRIVRPDPKALADAEQSNMEALLAMDTSNIDLSSWGITTQEAKNRRRRHARAVRRAAEVEKEPVSASA